VPYYLAGMAYPPVAMAPGSVPRSRLEAVVSALALCEGRLLHQGLVVPGCMHTGWSHS
jgi:hypothetical protein